MLLQELHSWCVSGETRTWFRNQIKLSIAFWQSSRLKLGMSAATCPLGISQSWALLLPPSQERIPYPHTCITYLTPAWKSCTASTLLHTHPHKRNRPPKDAAHISASHFLHLVDANWANGRGGSTETLGPLEDGYGGRMLSPFKTFTSQGREMQLDVFQT